MSKLYIGNLAAEANEAALRQLLQESGVGNVSSVLVKRGGYAFIDCPEQSTVDRAIEKLNASARKEKNTKLKGNCQQITETRKDVKIIDLVGAGGIGDGSAMRRTESLIFPVFIATKRSPFFRQHGRLCMAVYIESCEVMLRTHFYGLYTGRGAFRCRWTTKVSEIFFPIYLFVPRKVSD
ncbi:Insulin growth factor 2 mRNA-binding 3-A-like protein [Daphnia magna]|uniref:Insulin growth factor 2 mRNA-binding 3-A-like protein n=1 Tax=Daphnia magna TaxID=35525 RepID=A0A164QG70_9CRUS|nr:Insulin growth factor 2 mRNA-binding 3-A-like protein [Daphnia magna]